SSGLSRFARGPPLRAALACADPSGSRTAMLERSLVEAYGPSGQTCGSFLLQGLGSEIRSAAPLARSRTPAAHLARQQVRGLRPCRERSLHDMVSLPTVR